MMRSPSLTKALPSRRISRSLVCFTAAAALSSNLPSSAYAFAPSYTTVGRTSTLVRAPFGLPQQQQQQQQQHQQQSWRLYASKDEGFLEKAKSAVKSILPKKWFQSKEEKEAQLAKKRVRDEVSGGLREIFKDAPLPIRMFGSAITPLISSVASSLAETMGEQQRQMEGLLDDARSYIVREDATASALGEPIVVQSPFSQSSSTTSINGQTSTQIQASFPVQGSVQNGIATMTATEQGISQLVVQVGGRNINVNLSSKGPPTSGGYKQSLGKNRINKDDIIDVEFVEKK